MDGKANEVLVALLAKLCGVPRAQVELLHGAGGRRKLFEIHGLDSDAIDRLLESQNTTK